MTRGENVGRPVSLAVARAITAISATIWARCSAKGSCADADSAREPASAPAKTPTARTRPIARSTARLCGARITEDFCQIPRRCGTAAHQLALDALQMVVDEAAGARLVVCGDGIDQGVMLLARAAGGNVAALRERDERRAQQ